MLNELKRLIDTSQRVTLMTHRNPDLDSLASALLFRDYLNKLGKLSCLTSCNADKEAKQVLGKLGIELNCTQTCTCGELTILFDVANKAQLDTEICQDSKVVVFDHHKVRGIRGDLEFIDPESSSTIEVVVNVLRELGYIPSGLMATLTLAAILSETNRFSRATQGTFETVAWLLKFSGVNYRDTLALLVRELDESAKIALIKGSIRLIPYRAGSMIICVTNVNAYEGLIAGKLLDIGCDAAFVVSDHNDELRIVARSRTINVAELLSKIAGELNGEGGGHEGAGMLVTKVKQPYVKVLNLIISNLESMLGEKLREIK
ncbi:DHH family phosphoesterase [Caldivirga maquilingensis]|uniref:Phosphoesterase RecJ domain protein n=1 Tax=Caldivirga maquilingensis (strain ATCC 700844 / DSM 13496 / JCM 10307 / IC-167) TaxID=397948 RepID=A8MAG1_CALMQ|nr:DHH family phosphoesterase [Caldivirga maquilingensis]ABW02538.1 phosphoesterase RecJ domain protein [Caldivirga maquilingensis IC-167]